MGTLNKHLTCDFKWWTFPSQHWTNYSLYYSKLFEASKLRATLLPATLRLLGFVMEISAIRNEMNENDEHLLKFVLKCQGFASVQAA